MIKLLDTIKYTLHNLIDSVLSLANWIVEDEYSINTKPKMIKAKTAQIVIGIKTTNGNNTIDPTAINQPFPNPTTNKMVETVVTELIEECYNYTGVPLSFTVTPSKVCYREVWSHRKDGEPIYILEACQNPNYPEQRSKWLWMFAVEVIAISLKEHFKQSTVTVQYGDTKIMYLKEVKKKGDLQN